MRYTRQSISYQITSISSFELHTFYNDLILENLHIMVIFGIFSFAWTPQHCGLCWVEILPYGKVDVTFFVLICSLLGVRKSYEHCFLESCFILIYAFHCIRLVVFSFSLLTGTFFSLYFSQKTLCCLHFLRLVFFFSFFWGNLNVFLITNSFISVVQ